MTGGWPLKRAANGELTGDAAKFPQGITPGCADQIHALGLRFGIYTAIGNRTCQSLPGAGDHYDQDARAFASWGVDFVKVDMTAAGCLTWTTVDTLTENFREFGACLASSSNPEVVYSPRATHLPDW